VARKRRVIEGAAPRSKREFRRRGVAPKLLVEQVTNTAEWALRDEPAGEGGSWRDILLRCAALDDTWQRSAARVEYLRVMLAAHFTTVATFVPTDVDTHIRHHVWQEIDSVADLEEAVAAVDEAASWDPRPVSARTVTTRVVGEVSGHAGEWLAVRAGALGRALTLGAHEVERTLLAAIEAELEREAKAIAEARMSGATQRILALCTISAHNCGDLSRVVEAWPKEVPKREQYTARLVKLGHTDASRFGGQHHLAGHVNKEVTASENHRFLALRAPRGLRRGRALLFPIGPYFDAWGERIGKSTLLNEEDRGEILSALVNGLDQQVDRWGYQRAIAGLHRTSPGGVDRLVSHLPARLRHHIQKGPVRDALRLDAERFHARMDNTLKAVLDSYGG